MSKIYIDVPKSETLEEFILNCFDTKNEAYGSAISVNQNCKPTYFDPEFKKIECREANRSFDDLLDIVCTNFNSETSDKELAECLYKLWEDDKIISLFCPDINKLVFFRWTSTNNWCTKYKMCWNDYIPGTSEYDKCELDYVTEEDIDYRGNGEYSLKEILDLAGQQDNYEIK